MILYLFIQRRRGKNRYLSNLVYDQISILQYTLSHVCVIQRWALDLYKGTRKWTKWTFFHTNY